MNWLLGLVKKLRVTPAKKSQRRTIVIPIVSFEHRLYAKVKTKTIVKRYLAAAVVSEGNEFLSELARLRIHANIWYILYTRLYIF